MARSSWEAPVSGVRRCDERLVCLFWRVAAQIRASRPACGTQGQVVIPKQLRDEVGLRPGTEVEFERDGETVRVMPAGAAAVQGLRGRYASSGLAAALLADRDREPR